MQCKVLKLLLLKFATSVQSLYPFYVTREANFKIKVFAMLSECTFNKHARAAFVDFRRSAA